MENTTLNSVETAIENNLKHIHELLAKGEFIEAMETYLHEEVELREANDAPKKGKAFNVKFEQDFIDNQLSEFVRYDVNNYAVKGNNSFYDAVMELKLKDGSTMLSEQTVVTEWRDGKIYRERYYHA
ncbi:hypothetical protein [Aquimarina sp. 2201CG5-10]|uniref:hypothetical protein n=1 Tax=Aquimarina callyspongiae TaxID=3098150 RepID=UPI002AB4A27F|nr:hypothetical protein [Aquimarina sp. 2201CG5-10]MDY8137623.1 hypothetical protein [Aquimarina sp. 2201CG5-10]